MAGQLTPREQLDRIFDLVRRATHYIWLVAIVAALGGALSIALALSKPHQYESETVLLYRELISESVLQGREVAKSTNMLSSRYKEMLLARSNLVDVVNHFKLFPEVIEDQSEVAAADMLRLRIGFRDKGAGTFRITFRGDTPKQAKEVTAYLAERLQAKDNELRREQAEVTKNFLEQEKASADAQLRDRERQLAEFLSQHPEFAEESGTSATTGAGIRALQQKKNTAASDGGDPRLSALMRQKSRIQERLANPDKPVKVTRSSKTAERIAAEADVKQAQREVDEANRDLQAKLQQFTDKHPDVVGARGRLSDAQRRLRKAEADLPPLEDSVSVTFDRDDLERQLKKVEQELAWYRSKASGATTPEKASSVADDVVGLETEWSQRMRAVEEARERVSSLESRVFTAEITASSEFAEAAQLSVVDPAYLPHRPAGQSRKMLVIAGGMLFTGLGVALALGLALIDDRVYRRWDLERLDLGPVLAVVPRIKKGKRRG